MRAVKSSSEGCCRRPVWAERPGHLKTARTSCLEDLARPTTGSRNDRLSTLDVIPHHVAVELPARGEDNAALSALGHLVREADVLPTLVPHRQQEDVDRDPLPGTELRLAQCRLLRPRVGRVEQV